ncbi:MAG: hypothetical protein JSV44_01315 [Candidatus Zixiibacteriota bacterium]|nr:MAG: hypothetical protein JSV44_01315 [candidate division Zixibacteria bacterium]
MKRIILCLLVVLSIVARRGAAAITLENLLTDIRVVYLYENEAAIDWALVYYLGVENHCMVDLATVDFASTYHCNKAFTKQQSISSIHCLIPDTSAVSLDSAVLGIFGYRYPDIVIFSGEFRSAPLRAFEAYLRSRPERIEAAFTVRKFFRRTDQGDEFCTYLNSSLYFDRARDEIINLAGSLFSRAIDPGSGEKYTIYCQITEPSSGTKQSVNFLSGIKTFKLDSLIEQEVQSSYLRITMRDKAEQYRSYLLKAADKEGGQRIEAMLSAVNELRQIERSFLSSSEADSLSIFAAYLADAAENATSAVFEEAGVDHSGEVIVRDSPEGTRLKFVSRITNDGPLALTSYGVRVTPSWAETVLVIDSVVSNILPYSILVREYSIEIPPGRLSSLTPDSLLIRGRLGYRNNAVDFRYRAGAYKESPLRIWLIPEFLLIPPFAKDQIDRLVESAKITVVIHKPMAFAAEARIDFVTPKGVLMGAYDEEVSLSAGRNSYEFTVPIAIRKSFGSDRQTLAVNLVVGGKIVASDYINVAGRECALSEKLKVGIVPGSGGLLEDILVMTGANYRTLSDRYLQAGNLDFFDIIFFDTGCFEKYHSLGSIGNRLRKFMDYGGFVVVFGQPESWRDDLLPVSIISTTERLTRPDLNLVDKSCPLFNQTYRIDPARLLEHIDQDYISYPALVFPSERIIETTEKTVVLSMAEFGSGRFVYCGLPLFEMLRQLDGEAVKFFANLVNFSGK